MLVAKKNESLKIFSDWIRDNSFYNLDRLKVGVILVGEQRALTLFKQASRRIPAYRDFLKSHKINSEHIKTIADFSNIPETTKENYIELYGIASRCWDGELGDMHMISTSSGTTSVPHFWPRDLQSEVEGAYAHEFIFKETLELAKGNTLVINGFAMGNWIAGTFTLACINLLAWKGYPVTSMTPGYSADGIIDLLKRIAPSFDQVIITGHNPFLKDLVEQASSLSINLKKLGIKLLGTGQAITEDWRSYVLGKLGSEDYYHTFINLYGSADAALMGFETPLTITLREILSGDVSLNKKIFQDERLPSIYNFDPRLTFFEEQEGELFITKNSGAPLIRYNIHDRGGVLTPGNLVSHLDRIKSNSKMSKIMNIPSYKLLPIVYLYGREKFMVKIYGANIYAEHIQAAFSHEKLQSLITGRHVTEVQFDINNDPVLVCKVELNSTVTQNEKLELLIQQVFVEEVSRLNSEFNFLHKELRDKVNPRIVLIPFGDPSHFPTGMVKKTN